MMGWGGQGYGMGGVGWIAMLLFWIVIIAGTVLLVRYLPAGHGGEDAARKDRDPLDILKERYARGDIETEEFEERKRILGTGP